MDPITHEDCERIRKLLLETEYDVVDDDSFDTEDHEDDHVEVEEEDSQTDQDGSEKEEEGDAENGFFLGRDNTRWCKRKTGQTSGGQPVRHLPGVEGPAKNAKTPRECWSTFICDVILDTIVDNTNKYINTVRKNYSKEKDARLTTKCEIKAFIGLIYLAGVLRYGRLNLKDLWSTDGTGVELFRMVMSLARFRFLIQSLTFDDKSTRDERKLHDKLAPIRDVFDKFVVNCRESYSVSEYVTIDEKLESFRCRRSFRPANPNKQNRYGLKMFALVDSYTFYTLNLDVYFGKQPHACRNTASDVADRLCSVISGSGRNVTVDEWFTSRELAEKLLNNHKLTIVGAIKKNKREIPPQFVNTRRRGDKTSLFAFQDKCTLVSYVPKKGKNLLFLSTMHKDDKIDESTGDDRKPEIITFYSATKGAVDTVNAMCAKYSCARFSRRWPMYIFYSILNVAGINAYVVHHGNNNSIKVTLREFLKKLCLEMVEEHLKIRAASASMPKDMQDRVSTSGAKKPKLEPLEPGKRRRCEECKGTDRKTQHYCCRCYKYICLQHVSMLCKHCADTD